jgi:hypothetical protein
MRAILICTAVLLMCGAGMAQGERVWSGSHAPADPLTERLGKDTAPYSRSVTGTIVTPPSTGRTMAIMRADKSQLTFRIDAKPRTRADKGTPLATTRDISLHDYRPGDLVKVTYRVEDNRVLEIRLKRAAARAEPPKTSPDPLLSAY